MICRPTLVVGGGGSTVQQNVKLIPVHDSDDAVILPSDLDLALQLLSLAPLSRCFSLLLSTRLPSRGGTKEFSLGCQ